jgi:hypothetical protein
LSRAVLFLGITRKTADSLRDCAAHALASSSKDAAPVAFRGAVVNRIANDARLTPGDPSGR